MSDIVIDVPAAYTVLDRIIEKCNKEGNFLPEKVRKIIRYQYNEVANLIELVDRKKKVLRQHAS